MIVKMGGDTVSMADGSALAFDGGKFDLVRAALQALDVDPAAAGFSLDVWTDVPEQAGLGGSTAMLAGVVGCLLSHLGVELNRYELAEMIRTIEADVMKITCGYQDHYMTVFGGLNYLDFRGKEWMRQSGDEPFATVEPLADMVGIPPMILAHTGVKRCSGSVHKGLRERWLEGEAQVVQGYIRIAELGRLGKKALLARDWEELGRLMNENHAVQRDLGGSGESNEKLIAAALAQGALGAKLAGAGQGGTIIALTHDPEGMAGALLDAGAEKVFTLRPSEGLTVERKR